jgi:hypothetical protein
MASCPVELRQDLTEICRIKSVGVSAVSFSFRYSEQDYVRALRAHYASYLRLRLDLVVVVVVGIAGAYLWRSSGSHWLSMAFICVSGIFALMLLAAFVVIPPLAFRREPKFRDEYSLTFSEEGIHFKTAHIDSQLKWSIYSSALVDAHSYVLYYGKRSFTVIPKRVFQSANQKSAFEDLLVQHVPRSSQRGSVERSAIIRICLSL